MKLKELQTIDAEELASQPLPPPSFIVDGLIPYGLCVLAGPSKCGKSWLMLWLCMRVSQGWGRPAPVHKGSEHRIVPSQSI